VHASAGEQAGRVAMVCATPPLTWPTLGRRRSICCGGGGPEEVEAGGDGGGGEGLWERGRRRRGRDRRGEERRQCSIGFLSVDQRKMWSRVSVGCFVLAGMSVVGPSMAQFTFERRPTVISATIFFSFSSIQVSRSFPHIFVQSHATETCRLVFLGMCVHKRRQNENSCIVACNTSARVFLL
jgi:hypothetical protein